MNTKVVALFLLVSWSFGFAFAQSAADIQKNSVADLNEKRDKAIEDIKKCEVQLKRWSSKPGSTPVYASRRGPVVSTFQEKKTEYMELKKVAEFEKKKAEDELSQIEKQHAKPVEPASPKTEPIQRVAADDQPGRVDFHQSREEEFAEKLNQPVDFRKPTEIDAPFTNDDRHRAAGAYGKVISQFDVVNSPRYQPIVTQKETQTFCNIYVEDVTRAMGVDIPHGKLANEIRVWLKSDKNSGWKRVSANDAQHMANEGHPSLGIVPGGTNGHVVMVRPGTVNETVRTNEMGISFSMPAISQAGKKTYDAKHANWSFPKAAFDEIEYWYHE